jgi:hypothetical protein
MLLIFLVNHGKGPTLDGLVLTLGLVVEVLCGPHVSSRSLWNAVNGRFGGCVLWIPTWIAQSTHNGMMSCSSFIKVFGCEFFGSFEHVEFAENMRHDLCREYCCNKDSQGVRAVI